MQARPAADDMQNIMLISGSEMDGYTNLVFYRKRKTGDIEKDVEIKVLNGIIQFIDTEIPLNCCGRFSTQERPCRQEDDGREGVAITSHALIIYTVTHYHAR